MTHSYQITGMTCGSCTARVKSELLKLGDVLSADVQLGYPQATITMKKHIATANLQLAVARAGNYKIADVVAEAATTTPVEPPPDERTSYFPILLIFGYITAVTLLVQVNSGVFNGSKWMRDFMAGFFIVFSFFKLINLKGFAEGYRSYDIVARRLPVWGYVYPFVELTLGLAFLVNIFPLGTNIATILIMSVSCIGVIQSLLKKKQFQCACLGTVIKLPLSKVTLFEDLLMVTMSAMMIISIV